jgi:eukaryotic-like serine/threonine-protein kinase
MDEILAGRFRITRGLGHGGMSRVVPARDMSIGRDVALKIIHPHLSRRELIRERIMRELASIAPGVQPGDENVYHTTP